MRKNYHVFITVHDAEGPEIVCIGRYVTEEDAIKRIKSYTKKHGGVDAMLVHKLEN